MDDICFIKDMDELWVQIDNLDDNNDRGETWSIEQDIKAHMQLTVWMNFYHINETF
jgi:hypothetical protein